MVEEIASVGLEIVGVEHPPAIGDGDSELMFFVALAVKGKETTIVRGAKLFQRASNCEERRRLVVVAVECAKGPIQAGDCNSCAEARADGVFCHASTEMGRAHSGSERQPREWFEFVVDEECF